MLPSFLPSVRPAIDRPAARRNLFFLWLTVVVRTPHQATTLRSIKSLVPLLDRVLVQRVKAEAKTASGIFLPESSVKELNEAKVLAVGPGGLNKDGQRVPMGVAAGDKVLIPQVCERRSKSCHVVSVVVGMDGMAWHGIG